MKRESLTDRLRETVRLFDAAEGPLTTPEVADRLDLGRRTAYGRLERLVDQGFLDTKKVGANARVWWRHGAFDARDPDRVATHEQEFHSLVEATEEYAIFLLDPDGHVQTWNPGAERIKGYDTGEIVGEHFSTFYTDEDREAGVPERNLRVATEEGSVQDEGWRVRADGTLFWANVTITALRDDDGALQGYAKVTRDMTERREYEQRLREEKAFVQSLLNSQRDVFYAFDRDGNILRWNDRVEEVTGYAEAEIETMHALEFIADEAAEEAATVISRIVEEGKTMVHEFPLETADGETLPYEFTGGPITDDDGDIVGFTGVGRDIRDRKAREERLQRQHDELLAELDDVFTRIDDAFFAVDPDWRFTHVNERTEDLLDVDASTVVGSSLWEEFPAAEESTFGEEYRRAMETQVPTEFEAYYDPLDAWFEVSAYPSETGLSVYFRDVTERKEREWELELYETIFETVEDGVYVLDEDFRFVRVNDAYVEMTGYSREELLGSHSTLVVSEEVSAESFEKTMELAGGDGGSAVIEADINRADGTTLRAESRFTALPSDEGQAQKVGIVRDVSERVARERELEQYERMVETVGDGIYVLDEDARFVAVNSALCELTGYSREELLGAHATLVTDEENVEVGDRLVREFDADDTGVVRVEETVRTKAGETVPVENRIGRFDFDGAGTGRIGAVRDITEPKERERELETRIRQQEVVSELGQRALESSDLDALFAEASEIVAETLDNDYCKVLDLDPDAEELLLRQGVGWHDGIVGEATVSSVEDDSQAAYTLSVREPVVVSDLDSESRFGGPDLLRDHDVRGGISTIIGSPDDPWGILGTHDTDPKDFSEHDATFVQSVANILASAIERADHERELVAQRERIAALNNVNDVVRGITSAVIDQSTREEIERTVCDRLAETDSYAFAWIGDVDTSSQTVSLRAEAGVEGYLDDVVISVDPDDERSRGPTGRAFITREVQTARDAQSDAHYEPWRDLPDEYGFRASAAIPIVHENTIYGVLNVYTDRLAAFEGEEREVIGQLGEIVGHAIAAAERKRALLSDEVVELEFRIENVLDAIGVEGTADCTIELEHAVPIQGDEFLLFGRTTPSGVDVVQRMVNDIPFYRDVTFYDEDGEREADAEGDEWIRFDLGVSDPPVLSLVASLGGSVEEATIEDGDYRLRVHLSPSADVGRLMDKMRETYPSASLQRRQQLTVSRDGRNVGTGAVFEDLTERQRTALETAYHAGFFEWPRGASGEDLADRLGIAPPTFHQHLRKAERKVFDSVFAASPARPAEGARPSPR